MTVGARRSSCGGSIVSVGSTSTISSPDRCFDDDLDRRVLAQRNVDAAIGGIWRSGSKKFSIQADFRLRSCPTRCTTGIGNLVDADMATESAQLTALQTKQQLGVQALSIANQSRRQIALSLFQRLSAKRGGV